MDAQLTNLQGSVDLDQTYRNLVQITRAFMRDFGKLNLLLAEEETDDKTILMCVDLAVAHLNSTPPATSFDLPTLIQRGYLLVILYLTMMFILEGLMLLLTRNHLNWQESGQLIGLQDKTPLVRAHAEYFRNTATFMLKEKKISDSIMSAMSEGQVGVHSEYFCIHGYLWT